MSRDTARAMSEENVEIVRNGFAAFERGDMEALLRLADEDIVITQPSDVPGLPAQQHGHRGVLEAFEVWPELWDDFRVEILRIAAAPAGKVIACEPGDGVSRAGSRSTWSSASFSPFATRRSRSGSCSCEKTRPSKPPGCRNSCFGREAVVRVTLPGVLAPRPVGGGEK
jgi:ketosteroid isomerase-like protein